MYEPKLPVTGVSILAVGMASILGKLIIILVITTLSIILFRFIRLIIKEGNLNKLIKILAIFSLIILVIMGFGKSESRNRLRQGEEVFNEYKDTLIINQGNGISFYNTTNNIDIMSEAIDEGTISRPEPKSGDIIGMIYIENISLELPIIEDANDENLWIGAAHISGTPYYWEKGNSFIYSHNIKTYGKLFNRLKELAIGDKVVVLDSDIRYDYIVYHIEVVSPDDTECFDKIKGDYNLSMVTCSKAGSKRLIVYSERL